MEKPEACPLNGGNEYAFINTTWNTVECGDQEFTADECIALAEWLTRAAAWLKENKPEPKG